MSVWGDMIDEGKERVAELEADLTATNERARVLAERLAEYTGCPVAAGEACMKPMMCDGLEREDVECWLLYAAKEAT